MEGGLCFECSIRVQCCTIHLHLSFSSRFLRCSPFDEYKLWKRQVDNKSGE